MSDRFIKLTPTVSYIGIVFHIFTLIGKRGREGGGGLKGCIDHIVVPILQA